ncbi:hemerythrin domain-containing protein [Streptomyces sp. NPDC048723]|uniref:hemerythrin domain-containing protein n=1 Tax=Streptomyces sp. NPDC048723 TaxID=3365589 RepID=UPI0037157B0A
MHDALRRELAPLDRSTTRTDRDPRQLPTTAGWTLFKKALHAHHTAEDDALWPALRPRLAGRPKDLAPLEAMEAEHAAIDPLIERLGARRPRGRPAAVGRSDRRADHRPGRAPQTRGGRGPAADPTSVDGRAVGPLRPGPRPADLP